MNKSSLFRLFLGIIFGLVVAGLLVGFVSSRYYPISTTWSYPAFGKLTFDAKCSGCHSVEEGKQVKMGPSLANIGLEAKTRKPGMSAVEFILESIVEPDAHVEPGAQGHMPAGTIDGLHPQDLSNLLGFLASRGAAPDYNIIASLDLEKSTPQIKQEELPSVATLKRGWSLFKNELGCANCHSVLGEPGSNLQFPSLAKVSNLSTDYIIESLRTPSKYITPGYQQISGLTNSGEKIVGRLLIENNESIEIITRDQYGNYIKRELLKSDLKNYQVSTLSLMPQFNLSSEDEEALVALLKFLQAKVD